MHWYFFISILLLNTLSLSQELPVYIECEKYSIELENYFQESTLNTQLPSSTLLPKITPLVSVSPEKPNPTKRVPKIVQLIGTNYSKFSYRIKKTQVAAHSATVQLPPEVKKRKIPKQLIETMTESEHTSCEHFLWKLKQPTKRP